MAVVQGASIDLCRLTRCNSPALVIDQPRRIQAQRLAGRDQAGDVIQFIQLQRDLRLARQLAVAVDQLPDTRREVAGAGDQTTLAVEQLPGGDPKAACAEEAALVLVVDLRGRQLCVAPGAQGAALVGQFAGIDAEVAAGDHGFAGIVDGLRGQAHIALGIAAVIGVDACFDDPVVGQAAAGVQRDAVLGGQGLLRGERTLGFYRQISTGVDRRLGLQAGRFDGDRGACRGCAHDHIARSINLDITAGDHITRQLHAHTGLGADQLDRAHIHAAQRRRVNRQVWRLAAICRPCGGV